MLNKGFFFEEYREINSVLSKVVGFINRVGYVVFFVCCDMERCKNFDFIFLGKYVLIFM